jgi:hypothetical protein
MRLIIVAEMLKDEACLAFEEFYNEDIPPYAILSHTWDERQEIIYGEDCTLHHVKAKKGYDKILNTCKRAHEDKIDYVWIDTCCIDKSSSAELSEAINSMFLWYRNAEFCYVYLSDVAHIGEINPQTRWFTRGWTLQELIAPKTPTKVIFLNTSWHSIGSKLGIVDILCEITKINREVLLNTTLLSSVCIGRRLSWASNRITKRAEDEAYCLFGILDINMPIIYGEGHRAFYRLQEEIVRSTNDLTVLAWTPHQPTGDFCGFFAKSAKDFASCAELEYNADPLLDEYEISVTNKGLNVTATEYAIDWSGNMSRRQCALKLNCSMPGPKTGTLALSIRKVGPNTFLRARSFHNNTFDLFHLSSEGAKLHRLILLTKLPNTSMLHLSTFKHGQSMVSSCRFSLVQIQLPHFSIYAKIRQSPSKVWDNQDRCFFGTRNSIENWGAIDLGNGAVFVCLWSRKNDGWSMQGTLIDATDKSSDELRNHLFLYSEEFGYDRPHIAYRLKRCGAIGRTSIKLRNPVPGSPRKVSFILERLDDPSVCTGPRWIVRFIGST